MRARLFSNKNSGSEENELILAKKRSVLKLTKKLIRQKLYLTQAGISHTEY